MIRTAPRQQSPNRLLTQEPDNVPSCDSPSDSSIYAEYIETERGKVFTPCRCKLLTALHIIQDPSAPFSWAMCNILIFSLSCSTLQSGILLLGFGLYSSSPASLGLEVCTPRTMAALCSLAPIPISDRENPRWHKHQFCLCRSSEEFSICDSLGCLTTPSFLVIFALLINLWYNVLYRNLITWHLLILPYPSWQAKLKQMLWVAEAWTRCLPRKPPLPVFSVTPFRTPTKSTVAGLWSCFVFSWPLSKRLREILLHLQFLKTPLWSYAL